MKRISIVVASIATVVALGATVAASAQAAPELGQCVKLGKNTIPKEKAGKYEDPACLKYSHKVKKGELVQQEKGNYEWRPGAPPTCEKLGKPVGKWEDPACTKEHVKVKKGKGTPDHKGEYEKIGNYDNGPGFTAHGGDAKLKVPELLITTNCPSYTAAGEATSATEGTVTAKFHACEIEGTREQCNSISPSEPVGTISTKLLHAAIEEPVTLYYGSKYTPQSGTYLAEYECGGKIVGRVSNYLVGRLLPTSEIVDKMGKTAKERAAPDELEQKLKEEFSISHSSFIGPFEGTQEYEATVEYASEVELRVEEPQPKFEEFE